MNGNTLAVELAKLSLWVSTAAKDRPLSFLDHHLRLGNSLIGAWVKDLGMLPLRGKKDKRQEDARIMAGGLFEGKLKERLPVVLGEVMELLRRPSDKVEDIREKESLYDRILALLQPFKEVADVWVSTYFGNDVNETDYENALEKIGDPSPVWEREVRTRAWFVRAQEITAVRHFFHWELEFPEVFFEKTGQRKRNPGFDAFAGNPPWVNVQTIEEEAKDWLRATYELVHGKFDLYVPFFELGFRILGAKGALGLIVSNKFMKAEYGKKLRQWLLQHSELRVLADLDDAPIFGDDVSNYSAIVIAENHGVSTSRCIQGVVCESREFIDLGRFKPGEAGVGVIPFSPDMLAQLPVWDIKKLGEVVELAAPCVALAELVEPIFKGVWTGYKQAYVPDECPSCESDVVRSMIDGCDVDRYRIDSRRQIVYPYVKTGVDIRLITEGSHPRAVAHFRAWKSVLEARRIWNMTFPEAGKAWQPFDSGCAHGS